MATIQALKVQAEWYRVYAWLITLVGLFFIAWACFQVNTFDPLHIFVLIGALAVAAAFSTTSVAVSNKTGITYAIEGAITLATAPFFGYAGVVLIVAVHNVVLWLLKPKDSVTWKRSLDQLGFNLGMHTISASAATFVLVNMGLLLGEVAIIGRTVPWVLAAVADTAVNFVLIAGMLRLQHGAKLNLIEFAKSNAWAMQISILMMAIGGGFLAFAIANYDSMGVVIFFLPILLSAYAFRLYVRQMQSHLDNLENIVAERTTDLQMRTKELADLNKQKDTYLAVLTHDMMTPLSNIQLCTEILQEDETLSQHNQELSKLMLRSQRMLYGMVRNILDVEKLRVGESLTIHKAPLDVVSLVSQMVSLLKAEADERQIGLRYEGQHDPVIALADVQHFERVLLNLIGNALKYSPAGSEVTLRVWQESAEIIVEVADTGYGISAEDLPHIFDRYQRVKEHADSVVGTGLGLAITKAIVVAHNGTISAKSKVGDGSVFRVTLPAPLI